MTSSMGSLAEDDSTVPGMQIGPSQFPIRFETEDGLLLHGVLWQTACKDSVVIHVHGTCGNHYENQFLWDLARYYTAAGISMLAFSSRGANVITEAYRYKKLGYIGGALEDPTECRLDISASVATAEQLGFRKVFLQGHSFGCEKVLSYALANGSKLPLILLGPVNSREDLHRYYESQELSRVSLDEPDKPPSSKITVEWSAEGGSIFGSHCGGHNYPIPITIASFNSLIASGMLTYFDQALDAGNPQVPNEALIVHGSTDPYITYTNHKDTKAWFETRFPNSTYLYIRGADHHFQPQPAKAAQEIASIVSSMA